MGLPETGFKKRPLWQTWSVMPARATLLDLEATLYSGQAFRWRPENGAHEGFIRNRPVRVWTDQGRLHWEADRGLTEEDVSLYFRLDGSHERFLDGVTRDPPLDVALATFPGLRLLRQDPWEVFVAYLVSQNSNVGKIARTLENLTTVAGEPDSGAPPGRRLFPSAESLSRLSEAQLRTTGMGYRAPHLKEASGLVARGELLLDDLSRADYDEAYARLLDVPGVGPKVADCILLYGLGHLGAFPVDVWISRVVRELYFPRKRLTPRQLGCWARGHFGPWAGYAQHYLFHYRRVVGSWPLVERSQSARRRAAATSRASRARATAGG